MYLEAIRIQNRKSYLIRDLIKMKYIKYTSPPIEGNEYRMAFNCLALNTRYKIVLVIHFLFSLRIYLQSTMYYAALKSSLSVLLKITFDIIIIG